MSVYPAKDKSSETQQKTSSNSTQTTSKKEVCSQHDKLCVDYPSNWTAEVSELQRPDGKAGDYMVLRSADKTIALVMESGKMGAGHGPCEPGTFENVTVLKAAKTRIQNVGANTERQTKDLYASALIDPNESNKDGKPAGNYTLKMMLSDNISAAQPGTYSGVQSCSLLLDGYTVGSSPATGRIISFTNGTNLPGQEVNDRNDLPVFKSQEAAKKAFESPAYQQAFAVLASAHYK